MTAWRPLYLRSTDKASHCCLLRLLFATAAVATAAVAPNYRPLASDEQLAMSSCRPQERRQCKHLLTEVLLLLMPLLSVLTYYAGGGDGSGDGDGVVGGVGYGFDM